MSKEIKLEQVASRDGQMAAQIVVINNELQVRIRKMPKGNSVGNCLTDAKNKMLKRKNAPKWTNHDEKNMLEIMNRIIEEKDDFSELAC